MNINDLLQPFNLREIEKQVFSDIANTGKTNAASIAKRVSISRTSVYDLLDKLVGSGFIVESLSGTTKQFEIQSPEKIELLISERVEGLARAKESLEHFKASYYNKTKDIKPRLTIYEGKKELQQMMKDMLLYRDITICGLWPIKQVIKTLTPEFYFKFQAERLKRNIKIKVIWPIKQLPIKTEFKFLNANERYKREARIAPSNIDFSLGYTIYKDNVRFISSSKISYGFLVESEEMADMMKKQFDIIWKNSKPL